MQTITDEYFTLPMPTEDAEDIKVINTTNCVYCVNTQRRGEWIFAPDGRKAREIEITWEGWEAVFTVKDGEWHVDGDFFMADIEATPIMRSTPSGGLTWTGSSGKKYGKGAEKDSA